MISSVKFDEKYFEDGVRSGKSCYENYTWQPTRSFEEAIELFGRYEDSKILDYGCAKGYLVKAMRLLGLNAWGEDISDYAISNCPSDVKRYVSKVTTKKYDVIFCKDVLEHVPERQLQGILKMLQGRAKQFLFIIPLGDDGRYRIPVYEFDPSHVIKQDEEWWFRQFKKAGFKIYNFDYNCGKIKEHWVKQYPHGNGFFWLDK